MDTTIKEHECIRGISIGNDGYYMYKRDLLFTIICYLQINKVNEDFNVEVDVRITILEFKKIDSIYAYLMPKTIIFLGKSRLYHPYS